MILKVVVYMLIGLIAGLIDISGIIFPHVPRHDFHWSATAFVALASVGFMGWINHKDRGFDNNRQISTKDTYDK